MKTFTATEAQNKLGALMASALVEPVMVERSGCNSVVILSVHEYERLLAIEDAYWAARARKAESWGFAAKPQVKKLVKDAGA
jgi:prevent-host-death family protein